MRKRGFTLIELLVVIAIIALLLSIMLPSLRKVKESARLLVCKTNLRSIHAAVVMYADDHSGKVTDPRGDTTTGPDPRPNPLVTWQGFTYDRWCRKWYLRFYDYLETPEVYVCPSWNEREGTQYIVYTVGTEYYYVTYTANEYVFSARDREEPGSAMRKAHEWKYTELAAGATANSPIALLFADGFYEFNGWGDWKPWQWSGNAEQAPNAGRGSYRHDGKANFLVADGQVGTLDADDVYAWDGHGRYSDFRPLNLK